MPELRPTSPFTALFKTHSSVQGNGVTALDRDGIGIALLQSRKGKRSALAAKIRAEFGVELPLEPRRAAHEDVAFICTGPNTWLAISERGNNGFATALRQKAQGLASVTDQSDGYAVLRLTGPNVRDTLAKGVSIDIHDRKFCAGMAASTIVLHMGVTLWRLEDDDDGRAVFETAVFRSLASSLWHFISRSSAEFGIRAIV